jgi:hypothetical protein
MKMFAIDEMGKIAAVDPENVRAEQTTFTTERELAAVTSEWSGGRLVEIWNQLPGVTTIRKFTDRKSAIVRIWKEVQTLEPVVAPQTAQKLAKKARSSHEATTAEGSPKANKTETVVELLRSDGGATLEDIMTATGWQAHSVRGFISGVLGKRMGLTVTSAKREDGKRAYAIAL